jgi:hypothetical protein
MICSLCNEETDSDKVDKSAKSYICSNCVQLLLNQPQDKLKKAYLLAMEKEAFNKANAIKSFLEVNTDEPVNRHYTGKRSNREGFARSSGNDERTGRRFKKQKRITLYQGKSKEQAVL